MGGFEVFITSNPDAPNGMGTFTYMNGEKMATFPGKWLGGGPGGRKGTFPTSPAFRNAGSTLGRAAAP